MDPFLAFRIHDDAGRVTAGFERLSLDDLAPGDVVVRVRWSGINYKDVLAATGAGRILRRSPLVGGIDLAGEVLESADPRFRPGDGVLVVGCGLGETHDGGYAEVARVQGDWLVPLPEGYDARSAMILGTAGFTAALVVDAMERNGQDPAAGPVVVTGATGGVGSVAVDLLAGRGYEVVAVTGKPDADEWLGALGASRILRRGEIDLGKRPLEKALWAGAVDTAGGDLLAWILRTADFRANVGCVGLTAGADLHTTVMPFILRGVNLLGVNSTHTPRDRRLHVWDRLADDLKPRHLDLIATREVPFSDLPGAFPAYLASQVRGRTLVRIG